MLCAVKMAFKLMLEGGHASPVPPREPSPLFALLAVVQVVKRTPEGVALEKVTKIVGTAMSAAQFGSF